LLAPYMKWDASKAWSLGAELGYRITSYTGEETVSETLKRSGSAIVLKLSAQNKTNRKYLNPTYTFRSEFISTDGTEYDATLMGLQLVNTMKFEKFDFSQVLSVDRTSYGTSSTDRSDTLMMLALQVTKKIGPRWSLIGSADYSNNSSSDATSYSYSRYTVNTGVGYSF